MTRLLTAALGLATVMLVGLSTPATATSGWTSVSAGAGFTCGIRSGRIYCWGRAGYGDLGNGSAEAQNSPQPITSSNSDWASVTVGGGHACGLRVGRIYCWGDNGHGQLGINSDATQRSTPAAIASSATDWTSVSAGGDHTCATRSGRVYCWGENEKGQVGDNSVIDRRAPRLIASSATDWTSATAGRSHSCGVRGFGRTYCWGYNINGRLGDGTVIDRHTPTLVAAAATQWKIAVAGGRHSCGIVQGRVYCWGDGVSGALGDGSELDQHKPHLISSNATDWTRVAVGYDHTCGLRAGRIYCWGENAEGQVGDGTVSPDGVSSLPRLKPTLIASTATDWAGVTAGEQHSCGIRAAHLYCWGDNFYGELGDGTNDPRPKPRLVS